MTKGKPFVVGQEVVAVDAVSGSLIKNGQHYVISTCHYSPSGNGGKYWYVGVEGLDNDWLRPGIFAPIERVKTVYVCEEIKELVRQGHTAETIIPCVDNLFIVKKK